MMTGIYCLHALLCAGKTRPERASAQAFFTL